MQNVNYPIARFVLFAAALAMAALPMLSQTPDKKPSFEVVSIKPSAANVTGPRGGGPRGNRVTFSNLTLKQLLPMAYRRPNSVTLQPSQIIGGPSWVDTDRFDIQAKAEGDAPSIPQDQLPLLMQSMLEDRFQLKAHLETRELPIYNLLIAKDGPKLKLNEDQTPPGPPTPGAERGAGPRGDVGVRGAPPGGGPAAPPPFDPNRPPPRGAIMIQGSPNGMKLMATAMPLAQFVNFLQQTVGRTVIDKTDLKGLFDFSFTFSPEGISTPFGGGGLQAGPGPAVGPGPGGPVAPPTAGDPNPSLFTAVQEQLGLRLESTKGPVDILVIDSVQKPTEN